MNVIDPQIARSSERTCSPSSRRRELAGVEEALASLAAGRIVSEEQVSAWIDSLGTGQELPASRSGR